LEVIAMSADGAEHPGLAVKSRLELVGVTFATPSI
jgi:hypothetical protein